MKQERDILDEDFMVDVVNNGIVVWVKKDPNNDTRVTAKYCYKDKDFLFFRDGGTFWMKEVWKE